MAKGIIPIPSIEHEGDIEHFRSLIIMNGGRVDKVVWDGSEDDDAYIVFSADSERQVETIIQTVQDE